MFMCELLSPYEWVPLPVFTDGHRQVRHCAYRGRTRIGLREAVLRAFLSDHADCKALENESANE